ncbi:anti-sigma factor family protein [Dactylosporangium salmoneum]|uniref:Putative zinc-finger domain-containing protein n=1 Tax=Dactylosporangium salmoneum TaxID=53361 RepID=A0ABN3HRR3_9ACTN
MRCERLHDSAVYVLGALPPPEREAYERHLADCAQCRAEVAEFSDLPGLLGRLDPEIAAQLALASDLPDEPNPGWAGPTAAPPPPIPPTQPTPAAWACPTAAPSPSTPLSPAAWPGPAAVPTPPSPSAAPTPPSPSAAPTPPSPSAAPTPPSPSAAPTPASPAAAPTPPVPAAWAGPTATNPTLDPSLGRLNGSTPASGDPLLPRVLDRARSARRTDRRHRRWRTAGTALVAAFLGVVAVIGVRAAGIGQPDYVAMQEVAATVPVTASLALDSDSDSDGTVVRMRCAYKAGEGDEYAKWTYTLVVVPKSGDPEEINTWTARSGDEMQLTAHSHIQRSNIQRIEIRKGDGTPVLTLAA